MTVPTHFPCILNGETLFCDNSKTPFICMLWCIFPYIYFKYAFFFRCFILYFPSLYKMEYSFTKEVIYLDLSSAFLSAQAGKHFSLHC